MLSPFPVILADYDTRWPGLAADYAATLNILGAPLVAVHHIGSTAVPGLIAKPIIDLMPLVTDLDALDCQFERIEALGYAWHGEYGLTGRRYCTLPDETGTRLAQVHFFVANSPQAKRHIAFRDYLRAHSKQAGAYAAEKRRARDLHPGSSHAYSDEKSAWIRDIEAKALLWFDGQHGRQAELQAENGLRRA